METDQLPSCDLSSELWLQDCHHPCTRWPWVPTTTKKQTTQLLLLVFGFYLNQTRVVSSGSDRWHLGHPHHHLSGGDAHQLDGHSDWSLRHVSWRSTGTMMRASSLFYDYLLITLTDQNKKDYIEYFSLAASDQPVLFLLFPTAAWGPWTHRKHHLWASLLPPPKPGDTWRRRHEDRPLI